ncbi:MAG: Asp-tRNA(Asn)/Glu-tRNA(Gln) amidotransferase subunit GatC [Candidatus Liptonbacteria bacterium]
MSLITKKELDHLTELARLELTAKEEENLLRDLPKILEHFEELKEVATSIAAGEGIDRKEHENTFRDDESRVNTNQGKGGKSFPKKEDGYLKIPPVFE